MVDIPFIYGVADWNPLKARRLHGERFPYRRLPNRNAFERLHRHLGETDSFVSRMHDTGRTRSVRTQELEEHVLREIEEQPERRTLTASNDANMTHMAIWRVLGAEGLRLLSYASYARLEIN
ncbi:DUF4817 domain-containing protein [Trichonephila clavipes]|nr:DUF4817 domain-containing protein [Trichonephila clavipes]